VPDTLHEASARAKEIGPPGLFPGVRRIRPLSDIFREVEEDVRRERLEKFWKRYGYYVIALVVLLLAGVAGWQFWERQKAQERLALSEAFVAAQRISDPTLAANAFSQIAKQATGGYDLLARMAQANALYATGQLKSALDMYRQIGTDDAGEIGNAARLRAAWIIAATAPRKELESLLTPLNTETSAWQPMAREILAFSDYRASRIKASSDAFRALSEDARAPEGLRNRARAMALFLENGGGADVGTVPAALAPAATALPGSQALPQPPVQAAPAP